MGKELKLCPFCGGEVSIALTGFDLEQWYLITRGDGENKCTCRIFMESKKFYKDDEKPEKNRIKLKLIEAWNRRT